MFKRLTQFLLVAVLGMILSVAFAGTAQAEQCSPDGKICLVTDTSQPLVPPITLQFKVTSEANSFSVTPALRDERLVGQDASGMNVWEVSMNPGAQEGPNVLTAYASGPGLTTPSTSEFTVPVLAAAVNEQVTIRRTKKQVTAIYQYDGRTTLKGMIQIYLNSFSGDELILRRKHVTRTTGPGHQVLKVVLSRNLIQKKCQPVPHCSVLAIGRSWSGNDVVDGGTDFRKQLK